MNKRLVGFGLALAVACSATGCMPQLKKDDFAHDSGLYAYFNQRSVGSEPTAGALVADNNILWEAPAPLRACVRGKIAVARPANPYDANVAGWVAKCGGVPDRNLVVAGISGGGHKSEVFALSVMEELDGKYTLLDDVDAIASASGGSFAAVIYALSCDKETCAAADAWRARWNPNTPNSGDIYDLKEQNYLWSFFLTRLRPDHLFLNATTYHDSGESFVDVLRARMLENRPRAVFADLNPDRPNLFLTATNLTRNREGLMPLRPSDTVKQGEPAFEILQRNSAQHFSFTQAYFKSLGANLDNYEVLRALVASAAFPLIIDPTTVRNYNDDATGDRCNGSNELEPWYKPSDCESFVHLTDGGVHDNVAIAELQWFIECTFAQDLSNRPRIGPLQRYCDRQVFERRGRPKAVLAISIDSSLSASDGRNNQKGEERRASWGIPIRIGSTSDVVSMMSFSNTTQRKTDLVALSREMRNKHIAATFADFGLETLNDLDCLEERTKDACALWDEVYRFAEKHNSDIHKTSDVGHTLRDLVARVRDVDVSFELSEADRKALADAAPWVVARRVLQLCRQGTIEAMFGAGSNEASAICKGS